MSDDGTVVTRLGGAREHYLIPDFCSENRSGSFLRNVDNNLPHYTVSQRRRLQNINLENREEMLSFMISHGRFFLYFLLIQKSFLLTRQCVGNEGLS